MAVCGSIWAVILATWQCPESWQGISTAVAEGVAVAAASASAQQPQPLPDFFSWPGFERWPLCLLSWLSV